MKILTLVENQTINPALTPMHGLSVYIETERHRLLFDLGDKSVFLENASKLGVDIKNVDTLVISHGHHDHGGGLAAFLNENAGADIYIREAAFLPHFGRTDDDFRRAGIDAGLRENTRLTFTGALHRIDDELTLFSEIESTKLPSSANSFLYEETETGIVPDKFLHEQSLIIDTAEGLFLIAGCAHCGIVNIMERAEALKGREMDAVVGGFHLFNPGTGATENAELVNSLASELSRRKSVYYTGHCTGTEAFELLRDTLGDRLHYLATGSQFDL